MNTRASKPTVVVSLARRAAPAHGSSVDLPRRRRRCRCRSGGDIVEVIGPGDARSGMRSSAIDRRSRFGCSTRGERAVRGERCCARRLERAIRFREPLGARRDRVRLVHGEADLLPSLVVDRYGDYLVVQALSQGMDRLLPCSPAARRAPRAPGILARNDPEGAGARGARADGRRAGRDDARHRRRARGPDRVRGRSAQGSEDRSLPRPAREPRGRGAVCARPAARLLQLQRRIRAAARAANARTPRPSTSRRTPWRASSRTPCATA